jgi:hypothetical protein
MTRVLATARFWADAIERAVKTVAQTALATFFVDNLPNVDASITLKDGALIVGGAAVFSILTSIVSAPFGEEGTPSLVNKD